MFRGNPMEVLVAHHGYCFDGATTAAIFTRFLRETSPELARAEYSYKGLLYEPNAPPPGDKLRKGAVNAVLDYRYTTSPLLNWYFDHHVSAFQEKGSEDHFRADASGKKFHDGAYGSCTKLLIDVARERFGWTAPDLDELVTWSDIIDAARFPDADVASSFDPPAMAIAAVISEQGDDHLCGQIIPLLATKPLAAVAALPLIAQRLGPIKLRHEALAKRMGEAGEQRGDVAWFDLSDAPLDTVAKFVGYKLFPTAQYSVVLSRNPKRVKISVGFNPWAKRPRGHNVAALCERYGGGGHPVVGAVSLPAQDMARARSAVDEIIAALNV
jgi:hypothetical protein